MKRYQNVLPLCMLIGMVHVSQAEVANSSLPSTPWYVSVFGGAGSFSTNSITQTGAALYADPLAVNAVGSGSSSSVGLVGGNIGYQWPAMWGSTTEWHVSPAIEFEGYYVQGTQNGSITNDTPRLDLHQFSVSYPMHNGVFLLNAVLKGDYANNPLHPYVGGGVGTAVVSIQDATSTQTAPPEQGINHYNSNPNATDWTFAAQAKAGLLYDIGSGVSLFAEYRFLYLSPTDFTFGSTQYSTHVATTDWDVDLGGMYYNMGVVGIRYQI